MVDTLGKGHEIALFDVNADPTILYIPHIEISAAPQNVANFFRIVNVLITEKRMRPDITKGIKRREKYDGKVSFVAAPSCTIGCTAIIRFVTHSLLQKRP
jgi:hypothetical protein